MTDPESEPEPTASPKMSDAFGVLDALAILVLASLATLVTVWIAGQILGRPVLESPPEWLERAASSVWSEVVGSAACLAAIGRWIRARRSATYYMFGIFATTIGLLTMIHLATGLFPDEAAAESMDIRFRLELADASDNPIMSFLQRAPGSVGPRLLKAGADGYFEWQVVSIRSGYNFIAKAHERILQSIRTDEAPPHAIEICLEFDGPATAPNQVHLRCGGDGVCHKEVGFTADWMNPCPSLGQLEWGWPVLVATARASEAARMRWLVPSLETLENTISEQRSGYTRFEIASTLDAAREYGADSFQIAVFVNEVPAFIDGWRPDQVHHPIAPNTPLVISFGLQNLDFSGRHAGRERLRARIDLLRKGKRIESFELAREYVALRPAAPVDFDLGGHRFTWSGRYVPPTDEDKFEVFLRSEETDERAEHFKSEIDRQSWEVSGQQVVAVIRPPLGANRYRGVALGLAQPTGQIRFTFDADMAEAICIWINRRRSESDAVRSLIDYQAYRFEMRPLDVPASQRVRFCSAFGANLDPVERELLYASPSPGPSIVRYSARVDSRPWCLAIPHENEATAFETATEFLAKNGGMLLRIEQHGQRNIEFSHQGDRWTVDPNRIFSEQGRRASLAKLNPEKPEAPQVLEAEIERFAEAFLGEIDECLRYASIPVAIAMHNNLDNARYPGGLSIHSYGSDRARTAIHEDQDQDAFVLATDQLDFELIGTRWNAHHLERGLDDDGSLSERFMGRRYVNVEVEHGDTGTQQEMLESVTRVIRVR